MPALCVKPAAMKARTSGHCLNLVLVENTRPCAHTIVLPRLVPDRCHGARGMCTHHIPVLLPLAVDLVVRYHFRDAVIGARLPFDKSCRPRFAQHLTQLRQTVMRERWRAVSGIAPGSAKTDFLRLEQHDVHTRSRELQGGGQPGVAAANNTNISLDPAFQP